MSATLQSRPSLYSTAVGKKYVMAVSGMVLMVYVVAHMIGNLKLFFGAESLNAYSHWLREVGEPALPREWLLWGVRIVLLGALFAHLWAAYTLTMINRRARPERVPLQARLRGRGLRQPDDALDRDHRPAVRDLPPVRPDVGAGEPGLRER